MTVSLGFDAEQLGSFIEKVRTEPSAGATVWTASTAWKGGLCSEATIQRDGTSYTVPMDEPVPLGGSDTGPNMVEVVLGAYGCCLTTGFVANAAMRGIQLEGVNIEVEGDLDLQGFFGLKPPDEVWPGYTGVRAKVQIDAPGATDEEIQELHDAVVPTSPVGSIISRPVAVTTQLV
jgi:uncharacterized OsmC-like protein